MQPQGEATVVGPPQQAVGLEGDSQSVGGGTTQSRAIDDLGKAARSIEHELEDRQRLVQHADATYSVFHNSRI